MNIRHGSFQLLRRVDDSDLRRDRRATAKPVRPCTCGEGRCTPWLPESGVAWVWPAALADNIHCRRRATRRRGITTANAHMAQSRVRTPGTVGAAGRNGGALPRVETEQDPREMAKFRKFLPRRREGCAEKSPVIHGEHYPSSVCLCGHVLRSRPEDLQSLFAWRAAQRCRQRRGAARPVLARRAPERAS